MKPHSFRHFKLLQFAVILFLALSAAFQTSPLTGLAAPAQPAAPIPAPLQPGPLTLANFQPELQPRLSVPNLRADAPALTCGAPIPETCNSLQVIMIIDDSGSMAYNDPQNTRFQGVENMLDILAKEYYLPAIDANAPPPDIQVALVHFSSVVMNTPQWKPVNPKSLDDWAVQAKAFENDITGKLNTTQPLFTDFKPALQAAAKLAADKPQTPDCPRLVMLFTDGVPNLGVGNLNGPTLTTYMDGLNTIVKTAFPRPNDYLYVTAFESNAGASFWSGTYQVKWQDITRDTPTSNPPHAAYVVTLDLAPRMEKILSVTIGTQSSIVSPDPKDPSLYPVDVPDYVQSLRLTYYKLNATSTLTLTGPDGKVITPDGQAISQTGVNTSIEAITLKDPAAGAYKLKTSAAGGVIRMILLYKPVIPVMYAPDNPLLIFSSANIGIGLFDSQSQAVPVATKWLFKAELTQSGQTTPLTLTQTNGSFQTTWLPLSTDPASITACAALIDNKGNTFELFNGPVATIQIDPISITATPPTDQVCVSNASMLTVPLQLVNGRTQQNVTIGSPIQWQAKSATSPGGKDVQTTVNPVDPGAGSYALLLAPLDLDAIQTQLQASAVVGGKSYPFYTGQVSTPANRIADQKVSFSLAAPQTLADSLSVQLNQWFHADLFKNGAVILLGRHFFGWFGPTQVQVSGQLHLSDSQNNTAGISIQDFSAQLVSQSGGPNSQPSNAWQSSAGGSSQVIFPAPGLGLYQVIVTYQGKLPACASLADLPTQTTLLINDFWEYLFWLLIILILILFLIWLFFWLLCRFRNPLYGYLGIVDESGRILWKVRLSGDEERERGRACYDWEFEDLICQIHRLRIRSWDKRRRWLTLTVWLAGEKRDYERGLEEWQDIEVGGCDIVWWPHDPGDQIKDDDDPDGDYGGGVVVIPPIDPSLPGSNQDDEEEDEDPDEDQDEVDEIILVEGEPEDEENDDDDDDDDDRSETRGLDPGILLIEEVDDDGDDDEEDEETGTLDEDERLAIDSIEGLDPDSAARLRELGILTSYNLLDAAAAPADRDDLATRSSIPAEKLLVWVHRADLLQIPGIGRKTLRLLEACGVSTLRKLSHHNPENLFHHLEMVNAEKRILRRLPALEEVQAWVEFAKAFESRVLEE